MEKGDKVVFYVGSPKKEFAVIATLASKSFTLTSEQKTNYGHGYEFYQLDYGVQLTDIQFLKPAIPIANLIPFLNFIENKDYWGAYFQGGVKQITEEDYKLILGESTIEDKELIYSDNDIISSDFALEMHLEDFIYRNWNSINWGANLEIYEKDGKLGIQFPASIWYIDLLAIDIDTNDLVVIELKKGKTSDATVGQLLRYVSWVKENIAEENQNVRGIIIAKDIDEALKYSVKDIPSIDVLTYEINFTLNTLDKKN